MPIPRYGVLKGRALERRPGTRDDTHYHLLVAANVPYRVAINVQSQAMPSVLEYVIDEDWDHPLCERLPALSRGFTPITGRSRELALDYVRGDLFDPDRLRRLPFDIAGPDNDLNEALDRQILPAVADDGATVYAFGSRWGPERRRDAVFGFRPANGIHNVHMNQRNSRGFAQQEGTWQDGALLIHVAGEGRWIAIFLKFQSQTLDSSVEPLAVERERRRQLRRRAVVSRHRRRL
jgi:uncharacterized protein YukJ